MKVNFQEHWDRLYWLAIGVIIGTIPTPFFWFILSVFLLWWLVRVLLDLRNNSNYPRLNYSLSIYWRFIFGPQYDLKDHIMIISSKSPYWRKEGTIMAMRKGLIFYKYLIYFDDPEFTPREFTWWDLF